MKTDAEIKELAERNVALVADTDIPAVVQDICMGYVGNLDDFPLIMASISLLLQKGLLIIIKRDNKPEVPL